MTGRAGIPEPGRLGPVFLGGAAALGGADATAEAPAAAAAAPAAGAEGEATGVEAEATGVEAEAPVFEAQPQEPEPHPPAVVFVGARGRTEGAALGAVVRGSPAAIGAA